MNCLALVDAPDGVGGAKGTRDDEQVLIVDCGVTFDATPFPRGLGVDVVHPDFRVLERYEGRIAGVFLTHGHEDHIGALPYLLARLDVPVWGPPYALGLLRHRAQEHEVLKHARLFESRPRERYQVGPFEVEPVRVTHSIADATALAIRTSSGLVVHTGDFKFDETPPDGEHMDEARLEELGDEGVALLFSDSTNIDARGPTGSEQGVGEVLDGIVREAEGAVVVGVFASNVHRLRILGDLARRHGRFLVPLGRSVGTHARVARDTGYLRWPDDLVVAADVARSMPRRKILGIATGTQAEGTAALARLGRGEHPHFALTPGDTVVLSSRVIPGNEPQAYAMMGDLLRRGVVLRTWASDRGVHVSGHAHRDEQRRMLELVRPRAFIPAHGTLHHLTRHAALAREVGVEHVEVLENGDIAELAPQGAHLRKVERLPVPRVHRFAGHEVSRRVLKERMGLAEGGVVAVSLQVEADGTLHRGGIDILTHGVLDEEGLEDDVRIDAEHEIRGALEALSPEARRDDGGVAEGARLAVRRAFARAFGHKPLTLVFVTRKESRGNGPP